MELHAINSLLGIVLLFLDIWVIINIMQSSVIARLKAFWILIVLLLPYRYRFMVSTLAKKPVVF